MYKLSNEELVKTNGGSLKILSGGLIAVAGVATFLIGVANGILRPLGCSSKK